MKKFLSYILTFAFGYTLSFLLFNNEEINQYNAEVSKLAVETVMSAEIIMNNNNIWDIDGSDAMANYLDNYEKLEYLLQHPINNK